MNEADYCDEGEGQAFVFPIESRVKYWPFGRAVDQWEGPYKITERWRLGHGDAVYRLEEVEETVGDSKRGGYSEDNLTLVQ